MEKFELFLSYSEEIEATSEYESLDSISDIFECLEGATRQIRKKGLFALYKSLMKSFHEPKESLIRNFQNITKSIVDQGGFSLLLNYLSFLVSQLKIERDLLLEQELRVLLNILYATLIFSSAEEIQNEVSQESSVFEESLLKMIKLSTEYSYIPVKKICIVLDKYLKINIIGFENSPILKLAFKFCLICFMKKTGI